MLGKDKKEEILGKFRVHEKDTGSSEVQIALLTERINEITDHLRINRKDFNSRRSLLIMVGKRRRLLRYLKSKNEESYTNVMSELKIRK